MGAGSEFLLLQTMLQFTLSASAQQYRDAEAMLGSAMGNMCLLLLSPFWFFPEGRISATEGINIFAASQSFLAQSQRLCVDTQELLEVTFERGWWWGGSQMLLPFAFLTSAFIMDWKARGSRPRTGGTGDGGAIWTMGRQESPAYGRSLFQKSSHHSLSPLTTLHMLPPPAALGSHLQPHWAPFGSSRLQLRDAGCLRAWKAGKVVSWKTWKYACNLQTSETRLVNF